MYTHEGNAIGRRWLLAGAAVLCLAVGGACSGLFGPSRKPVAELKHEGRAVALAFSPDGKSLAAACRGGPRTQWAGSLAVWDLGTGKERLSLAQEQWANAVAFSPDGKMLAVALGRYDDRARDDEDDPYRDVPGEVRVYDAATGKLKETLEHKLGVYALAFSPDGKLLASAGGEPPPDGRDEPSDAEAYLWDTQTWEKKASLKGLRGLVRSLAFSPDGKALAVGDGVEDDEDRDKDATRQRGAVRLFGVPAGKPKGKLLTQPYGVRWLAFASGDSLLVQSEQEGDLALWDLEKAKRRDGEAPYRGKVGPYGLVRLSPDRKALAVASGGSGDATKAVTFAVWDLGSGKKAVDWEGDYAVPRSLTISHDGKLLAAGLTKPREERVKVWALPKR